MAWWGQPGAYFRVRDALMPEGWRKVPALHVLDGLGLPEADLRELSRPALGGGAGATDPRRLLGERLLFELWLAAFSLGLRTADIARPGGHGGQAPTLSTRVARRALTTMALGAVRNLVPRHRLATAAAVLTPVVRGAVLLGAEIRYAGGSVPSHLR
jgi:hypothetical protein